MVVTQIRYLFDESCGGVWVLLFHGGCFSFLGMGDLLEASLPFL